MTGLKPAAELAAAASKPYPNDNDEYRRARTALLAEEVELRRHIERVAAQRRALPLGGEARDYAFEDENGSTVKLAASLRDAGTPHRIEWYPGAEHGFVFPNRVGVYQRESAERHYERLFALFDRTLRQART